MFVCPSVKDRLVLSLALLFLCSFAFIGSGCVTTGNNAAAGIGSPGEEDPLGPDDDSVPTLTVSEQMEALSLARLVEARDAVKEDATEWYRQRYMGLGLPNLQRLSDEQRSVLRDRVQQDKGAVYVIVHPAYYLYFQERSRNVYFRTGDPAHNLVESYLAGSEDSDPVERLMREQIRIEREFLKYAAAENHVVLLVVPGDYRHHPHFRFNDEALDEYARYLNEIGGSSETFLYVESTSVNRGFVSDSTLDAVEGFFEAAGARKVLLGGGFVGRCQEDFYRNITERMSKKRVAVVAEISSASYADVDDDIARNLLGETGRLDPVVAVRNIKRNAYKRLDLKPRVVSLLKMDPVIGALVLQREMPSGQTVLSQVVPAPSSSSVPF